MKNYKTNLKAIVLSTVLLVLLLPIAGRAQAYNKEATDSHNSDAFYDLIVYATHQEEFFNILRHSELSNRSGGGGITIGGMQNDNPTPLGSGLLVMTTLGAGYVAVRRRRNKGISGDKGLNAIIITMVLLLGLTHCKKNDIAPTSDGDTVFMTLEASCGGGRTIFDPNVPGIRWEAGATEYISVGSSVNGYLGELSGKSQESTSATNRLSFSGTITAPAGTQGEKLYFFYLGNGRHYGRTPLDFSNQETSAGTQFVTNYVIAIGEGTVTNSGGSTYTATADLDIKTAIAYINVSNMAMSGNVSLHGPDVYSTVTIDYKAGTITGDAKGSINIGPTFPLAECNKYVALIPSVSTETTLVFDSDTKSGGMTFPRGIQENRY